jgi:hypothetical protein
MNPRARALSTVAAPALACLAAFLCAGCAGADARITDAFPPARAAAPWLQHGAVWSGAFDAARASLGADAPRWARHSPRRVWIGAYVHEDHAERRQTLRCFEFESESAALLAYRDACPPGARPLDLADEACWSPTGAAFRRGRLVGEVFGDDAEWSNEVSAAVLATHFAKRLAAAAGAAR